MFSQLIKLQLRLVSISLLLLGLSTQAQAQEDPASNCREAAKLLEDDDLDGALEEARWCVEGLEQMKQAAASDIFPDEINGFVGAQLNNQSAMGINMLERQYNKGNQTVRVHLSTGNNMLMGGLGALANMGMMGVGKKIRVQKRTVRDMSEGNKVHFIAQLKSGGFLNFESTSADNETVLEFVKAFPIAKLDESQQ